MISKASLHFFKSQVRNYFKLITLNGKTYEVPPNFREPVYDMENLQNSSNVILMRHGNTLFNLSYDQIFFEKGYGNEILDLWHDDIFRDSPLSDFGIEQCKHTAQFAEQFDIDMVLISPMRRTLQTAHYLLRNHPQKDEIKYVVHPGIRERVYGYCEMTRNWGDKYNRIYKNLFPNLDISLMMNQDGTYDELFYSKDFQPEVSERFKGMSKKTIDHLIMEAARDNFPKAAENLESTCDRTQRVKDYVKNHIQTRSPEKANKKILLITHCVTLRIWMGNWSGMSKPYQDFPKNTYWVCNCEFYPDIDYDYATPI
ncbi:unnamed protein product [Moneuplotes crassus]|uniref:Phosphoglycerate mutase family protein n=1 Tax=Euplotes crassus TaxID=5936 RepID=A0AAD1XN06_EUPCR|nr:unnamed protein product [Moneuplotes crassus]